MRKGIEPCIINFLNPDGSLNRRFDTKTLKSKWFTNSKYEFRDVWLSDFPHDVEIRFFDGDGKLMGVGTMADYFRSTCIYSDAKSFSIPYPQEANNDR